MFFSLSLLAALGLSCTVSALNPAEKAFAKAQRPKPVIEKRVAHQEFKDQRLRKRAHDYLNKNTEKFVVNGTGIPDVDFDIGESYAGLLPISGDEDETRELFFW